MYKRGTVSKLWFITSGGAFFNICNAISSRPRKSGTKISILILGEAFLTASIQSTKCCAPPSLKSSRSTLVITTYLSCICAIVRAKLAGSFTSGANGLPSTSQNGQRRVQISPKIIKVAVPLLKHSPILGQLASSQTVCRLFSRKTFLIS